MNLVTSEAYQLCEINVLCNIPTIENASVSTSHAFARDDVTFTCKSRYEFQDGSTQKTDKCSIDKTWNIKFRKCYLKDCYETVYDTKLFDGNPTSCTTYTGTKKVYLDQIGAISVQVVGTSKPCYPAYKHITVKNSVGPCPLQKTQAELSQADSCHFKCSPGQDTKVIFSDVTVCEIIIN